MVHGAARCATVLCQRVPAHTPRQLAGSHAAQGFQCGAFDRVGQLSRVLIDVRLMRFGNRHTEDVLADAAHFGCRVRMRIRERNVLARNGRLGIQAAHDFVNQRGSHTQAVDCQQQDGRFVAITNCQGLGPDPLSDALRFVTPKTEPVEPYRVLGSDIGFPNSNRIFLLGAAQEWQAHAE